MQTPHPMEILHAGLPPHTLRQLQEQLARTDAVWIAAPIEKPATQIRLAAEPAVFLLGEEIPGQIKEAQAIYRLDKYLSVLLLASGASFQRLKQALQFSPFIGPTIQIISTDAADKLSAIVADHAARTRQRRSYARINPAMAAPASGTSQLFEQIRADYLGKMMEEAPIGTILLNHQGVVLNINAYGTRLFGKTEKQVLNQPLHRLFPEHLQPEIRHYLQEGFRQQPKRIVEIPAPTGIRYLEVSAAEMGGSANASYRICILNDITSEIEAKQRAERNVKEIEKINDELRKANNDLDTFVYTASHDLKSPILNIEGLVTILKDDLHPAPPHVAEALERIGSSIRRFKDTLIDLTEVAKIQKGLNEEKTLLVAEEVISEVAQRMEPEITRSQAVLEVHTEAAPKLDFSGKNIKSILYNLISNSIKYCPAGRRPHIVISTQMQGSDFVLSVADNGMGIPEDKLPQIFTLFHRLHPQIEGTGIGLYIVKRIVENAGGRIEVESQPDVGTTFRLFLPQE